MMWDKHNLNLSKLDLGPPLLLSYWIVFFIGNRNIYRSLDLLMFLFLIFYFLFIFNPHSLRIYLSLVVNRVEFTSTKPCCIKSRTDMANSFRTTWVSAWLLGGIWSCKRKCLVIGMKTNWYKKTKNKHYI